MSESESYVTTDGQSASLSWYNASIWGLWPDFYFRSEYGIRLTVTFLFPWCALSNERTGLSFVSAAGPCQRSLSRVLVPWDLSPYFTVPDLRIPFSSPPTTRRVTVEVFDPASTRVTLLAASGLVLYSRGTDDAENTVLLLRSADYIENRNHVIAISSVHWRADCCLATSYKHSSYYCVRVSRSSRCLAMRWHVTIYTHHSPYSIPH
jgi:hypothetical protein